MQTSKRKPKSRLRNLDAVTALVGTWLTRPRTLTPQVVQYLLAYHDVAEGEIVAWLRQEVPKLESYELDLLFSPLFTPDFDTRVQFEDALGESALDDSQIDELLGDLRSRRLCLTVLQDGEAVGLPFPDVVAERFVRLLHLDVPLPSDRLPEVASLSAECRAYLRDRAWRRPQSLALLPTLIDAARRAGSDFSACLGFLTDFMRTHRPASRDECVRSLVDLAEAYEEDLRRHESGSRSFFNDELKASYGGQRAVSDETIRLHKGNIAMARALHQILS